MMIGSARRLFSGGAGSRARVAFIGLGNLGSPICARITAAPAPGFDVSHFDVDAGNSEQHSSSHGGTAAASLGAALAGADFVVSCLPTTTIVESVVADALADGAVAGRGATWVDCTSGDPAAAAALASRLSTAGVAWVDCAVSGGPSLCTWPCRSGPWQLVAPAA